jgi:hypothetical protein
MLDEHKHHLLEMGASGRLLIAGQLEGVLPIENAVAQVRAKPITAKDKVQLDPQKTEALRRSSEGDPEGNLGRRDHPRRL